MNTGAIICLHCTLQFDRTEQGALAYLAHPCCFRAEPSKNHPTMRNRKAKND